MNTLELLEKFDDMIWKYSRNPFHHLKGKVETPYDLKLSEDETIEFYHNLKVEFITLINEYDESRGVTIESYIGKVLGWRAVNMARSIIEERSHRSNVDIMTVEQGKKIAVNDDLNPELTEAMKSLSKRQRQVIELHIIKNYKVVDVARQLGITKQAVVNHRKHGLEKLKKHLEGK